MSESRSRSTRDPTRQYWVIAYITQYVHELGYEHHPIGMTFQYPPTDQVRANDALWASPEEWISPGFDDGPAPVERSREADLAVPICACYGVAVTY